MRMSFHGCAKASNVRITGFIMVGSEYDDSFVSSKSRKRRVECGEQDCGGGEQKKTII